MEKDNGLRELSEIELRDLDGGVMLIIAFLKADNIIAGWQNFIEGFKEGYEMTST